MQQMSVLKASSASELFARLASEPVVVERIVALAQRSRDQRLRDTAAELASIQDAKRALSGLSAEQISAGVKHCHDVLKGAVKWA